MIFFNKKMMINAVLLFSSLLLVSTAFIGLRRIQSENNYETLAELRAQQEINEVEDSVTESKLDIIDSTTNSTDNSNNKYTYEPNENSKWLAINTDYFGWIKIAGSNIDYPFVRSHDNKDYLTLDFNKNFSDAGTLFMDYRNLGNFNDQHTIIYGHYMKNQTLFHNLTLYHEKAYFEKNQIIELSGLYETKTYKIFSVYEISADDYAFTLDFNDDQVYQSYLDSLIKLSLHTVSFELDSTRKLLSLVTCSYGVNNGRTIIHAIEL